MADVIELMYKTQDTPLFLLIIVGLVFIIIAIVYVIYVQSKTLKNVKQEEVPEENINYNIFSENKDEVNIGANEVIEEVSVTDQVVMEQPVIELPVMEQKEEEEVFDLRSISKELESLPRERTINLTPYELEQEEQAIISYDELVTQSIPLLEISKELREEVLTPYDYNLEEKIGIVEKNEQVVPEPTSEVKPINDNKYDHEESFLDSLKNLKSSLN